MRILIDFTTIPVKRAGAGVYAENLVRELVPLLREEDQLFLLVQDDETSLHEIARGWENIRVLTVPSVLFRNRIMLVAFEQFVLPCILLFHHIDILHTLHYTLPLWSSAARVVTFHDLTMLLWPQLHTRGRRLIQPSYMRLAWKLADAIVFVSAATQRDAERILPQSRRLRAVTPLGVTDEAFVAFSPSELREQLVDIGISQPYLLFIGTIEPRKNILRLIQAFEAIADQHPDCTLVLAGKPGWHCEPVIRAMTSSRVSARIRHLGYISNQTKHVLLAGCAALVYPSLYEGFGLPVLEGMAAGAPVITSNVSSLPEVTGDAAILINPESTEDLAEAIEKVLSPAIADELRQKGPLRARLFTWERTAAETWKVYLAVYQQR